MRRAVLFPSIGLMIALLSAAPAIANQAVQSANRKILIVSHRVSNSKQNPGKPLRRIQRIENGLLPLVLIKGQPLNKMRLANRMSHYKIPGVSIAVINNYAIEWAKGYGLAESGTNKAVTPATLFNAGSISKPITAIAVLRMAQENKLSLDEDINKRLVSWKLPENEFTKEKKVTLRSLLSHCAGTTNSGVGEYASNERIPTLLEALDGKEPSKNPPTRVDFVPGSKWRYSGGGYAVIQQLLIDLRVKPFPLLMQENVFQKLGMQHSTFQQPPLPPGLAVLAATGHQVTGEKYQSQFIYPEMAAAGLWTTSSDLARFVIELQEAKAGKSDKFVSAAMINQMLTPQIENDGLGLFIAGRGKSLRFSHGGGNHGFFSYMIGYPATVQGAVVMTNGGDYWDLIHEIIRGIAKEYEWPDYIQERVPTKVSPAKYSKLAGQYEIEPGFTLTIADENGRLFVKDSESELFPESTTRYFLTDGRQIIFTNDEQGDVAGMAIQQNDFILRARKIK